MAPLLPRLLLAACVLAFAACGGEAPPAGGAGELGEEAPRLLFEPDPGSEAGNAVVVEGLSPETLERLAEKPPAEDEWVAFFAVYTGEALHGEETEGDGDPANGAESPPDRPPVLGDYAVEDDRLVFTPRFPWSPGLAYTARFRPPFPGSLAASAAEPVTLTFRVPAREVERSTEVTAVHPSGDEVPENLLRLYLHFSAPMSRGEAYRSLRLVEETPEGDRPVEHPFVAPERELWNAERTRLTLLFDPGRIKRQVGPNLDVGPPLAAGRSYRLEIDPAWRDGRGAPLARGFEKRFRAAAADRRSPDPGSWRLEVPAAGSREPLTVVAPEPFDHALARRLVTVHAANGGRIAGEVELGPGERRLRFVPAAPWRDAPHELRAAADLEDPSGNALHRPFETPIAGDVPAAVSDEPARREFRPR